MKIFTCRVPTGTKASEFDPFPASEKATKLGCTCPAQTLWPEQLRFASDCPLHELVKVPN
jgi:hypothetical protein